jgi:hypothetical protein
LGCARRMDGLQAQNALVDLPLTAKLMGLCEIL